MRRTVVTFLGLVGVASLLVLTFSVGCVPGPGRSPAPLARMPPPSAYPASAGPAAPAAFVPYEPPPAVAKAPEPVEDREKQNLNVRVSDADGQPVAGVRVQAVTRGGEIRTAETAEDGGARFIDLGEDTYTALARAEASDGRVTRWREHQDRNETAYETSLVLESGAALSGEVVEDGSGSPVAGAVVSVEEGGMTDDLSSNSAGPPFAAVSTNSAGAFGPVAVPRDFVVTVRVKAPNHASLMRHVRIRGAEDTPRIRLEMTPGGVIVGVVRTPDGRPVAGAHVAALFGLQKGMADEHAHSPVPLTDNWCTCTAVADADGRYRIDRTPLRARCAVFAWSEGWATSAPAPDLIVADNRPPTNVDLVLRHLGRLDVLVRDPEDRPVVGARVVEIIDSAYNYGGHAPEIGSVPTGPVPGTYRVEAHFPGDVTLGILAKGLAPTLASAEVGEGEAREIIVRLGPAASIRGVVLDDRGVPVNGATVRALTLNRYITDLDDDDETDELQTIAAPDGKFEIPGLAGGVYEMWAGAEVAGMATDENVEVRAPAVGVVLRLVRFQRSGGIRFRLLIPPGGSVPDVVRSVGTDYNWLGGVFTEDRRPAGPGSIRLFPPGYAALTIDYVVVPEETTDLGEFLLDEGVVLRGRVTDSSGKAVEGATVRLVERRSTRVSTNADGGFEIPHGERGDNRINVVASGFLDAEFTVAGDAAAPAPSLVLRRGGLLRVRAVDATGRPVPCVDLHIRKSPSDSYAPLGDTDVHGIREVRLAAGTYGVGADGAEWAEAVLEEGGTTDVTLSVR